MMGHTKLSMTQHYAKVLDQNIMKDMEHVEENITLQMKVEELVQAMAV